MSATVEFEKLAEFFEEPVQDSNLSFKSLNGASSTASVKASSSKRPESNVGICFVSGRQYPVETFYTPTPVEDYVDAALRTTFQIHFAEPFPGDILVFLPGQEEIDSLGRMIAEYGNYLDTSTVPDILALQLYSGLPQNLQQLVFRPAPTPRTRKVIIATNIAETSITVPGVRFVIDSGKEKAKKYRHKLGLDSLLVSDISRSSAAQRKGRAGREAPGKCYRLYTEQAFYALAENSTPEILRVDVSSSILNIKARGKHDIVSFDYLDPPTREGLLKALETLYTLGALDNSGNITPLGNNMSKLPLDPQLSKVLISALEESNIDILPEVIDIIAALSVENLLLSIPHALPDSKKTEIEEARRPMQRREGDHLYYLAIFRGFRKERLDRRVWAQSRFYSHPALVRAGEVRKQLRNLCSSLCPPRFKEKLYPPDHELEENIPPEKAERILRCFLRGYFSNSARLVPDGTYRTVGDLSQTVAIHPQSVLFAGREGARRRFEAIMYHEWVFTTKPFARYVSAVQMDWVVEANPKYLMGRDDRG
ncbi:P-loop containing nucleoside triphosphate hydrolase protein [Tirmania nivea]|nr:P-loop containing nucleoside triphosphate hydrolase protein [Tirmania nivea]